MPASSLLLASAVMLIGAAIQGAVGFGSALFAAPLLLLISASFVPVPINIAGGALCVLMILRERGGHHWKAVRWPLAGLLPGTVTGAVAVRLLAGSGNALPVFFAGLVLFAVGLSIAGFHPERRAGQLLAGGVASGLMGTAAGIGGPPLALFFQHSSGPDIRGSLSRFFLVSAVLSLVVLWLFGQCHQQQLETGAELLPATVAGFGVSGALAGRLDRGHARSSVLLLSGASAMVVIARTVIG